MPRSNGSDYKRSLHDAVGKINRPVRLMEICGTHTHVIGKAGLRALFPESLELISGPGCPVCVTSERDIEKLLFLAGLDRGTVCVFGDMVRVPGVTSSLERKRAEGADVRVVYSPNDAVELARDNPGLNVVFIGIGFETTAPAVAASILRADELNLSNFWCLVLHKRVTPAMEMLLSSSTRLDGFLTPGHVSVIIGAEAFEPLAQRFGVPCVAAGFTPADVMEGLAMLAQRVAEGRAGSFVQYARAVRPGGNAKARQIMADVFDADHAEWRGLGSIEKSGMRLRPQYARFDAGLHFEIPEPVPAERALCQCGSILRGLMAPPQCPQFGKSCTPRSPLGPCMVSSEGACAARYRYG